MAKMSAETVWVAGMVLAQSRYHDCVQMEWVDKLTQAMDQDDSFEECSRLARQLRRLREPVNVETVAETLQGFGATCAAVGFAAGYLQSRDEREAPPPLEQEETGEYQRRLDNVEAEVRRLFNGLSGIAAEVLVPYQMAGWLQSHGWGEEADQEVTPHATTG